MTHARSYPHPGKSKEDYRLSSHPYCPLIGGNCDRKILQHCGEQNPNRPPMFPVEICPHALLALVKYAKSRGLNQGEIKISGHSYTATLTVFRGPQLANVTRGTMTTSKRVFN